VSEKRAELLAHKGLKIIICVPFIVRDRVEGVMNLGAKKVVKLGEEEIDLLMTMGHQIGNRILQHFTSIYVPHPSVKNFEAEIVKGAEKKLEEFVEEHFQGVSPKAQVILGDAAEEILNYVRSEGIDLVIMGTHGRKGLEKIVFGSVAERVVKKSPVPVLTINPYGKGEA
jgi:nucleotide-binding universal stress UspA family protein